MARSPTTVIPQCYPLFTVAADGTPALVIGWEIRRGEAGTVEQWQPLMVPKAIYSQSVVDEGDTDDDRADVALGAAD
jgi:hypothetical protein